MFNFKNSKNKNRNLERENYKYQQALERKDMALNLAENTIDIFKEQKNKLRKDKKQLEKEIKKLILGLIPSEYAKTRMKNKTIDSWESGRLIKFTINTVKNRERKLKKELRKQKNKNSDLKLKLSRIRNELKNIKDIQKSEDNFKKENKEETKIENNKTTNDIKTTEKPKEPQKEVISEKYKIKHIPNKFKRKTFDKKDIGLEDKKIISKNNINRTKISPDKIIKTINKLDKGHLLLIKVIGNTGAYRTKELKEKPRIIEVFQTDYLLNSRLNELIQVDILDSKQCRVGARGHNYKTFALTEKGKEVYRIKFNKDPKKSFKDWLINEHTTLEHGVLIHDTAIIFKEYNYDVLMDRENNTANIYDSDAYSRIVFDLTIKKDGMLKRIECERGKGNPKEFNHKLNKFYLINKSFHFVTPNKKSLEKVKNMFFKWVSAKGGRKKIDVKMNLITLEKLKKDKNNWEVYDFTK